MGYYRLRGVDMDYQVVRTAQEPCGCEDPWQAHPDGFIFERGDGAKHYPQERTHG